MRKQPPLDAANLRQSVSLPNNTGAPVVDRTQFTALIGGLGLGAAAV